MRADIVLSSCDRKKLEALENPKVWDVVRRAIDVMKPDEVLVFDDSPEDVAKVPQLAIDDGEEDELAIEGHTIHYDGYHDQARDKPHTATLLPPGHTLSRGLNMVEREAGLKEIFGFMDGRHAGGKMAAISTRSRTREPGFCGLVILRCWRRLQGFTRPGESALGADGACRSPDGLSGVVRAGLAGRGHGPAINVRFVDLGTEGCGHDIFSVFDIGDQFSPLSFGDILNDNFVGFVFSERADRGPLQSNDIVIQGEMGAVGGQEQVGRRVRWRRCRGESRARCCRPLTQGDDQLQAGIDSVVDHAVIFLDRLHRDGIVGRDAAQGVVFLDGVLDLLAGGDRRLAPAQRGGGKGGRRGCRVGDVQLLAFEQGGAIGGETV